MISLFYVTNKGQNYITRAMTDRALVFTRGEFGNGQPPSGGSPLTMTALGNKLGPLNISDKRAEENSLVITTQFSNRVNGSILPGFKLTEVGLYGRLQTYDGVNDPDGPEVLLFYGWTTEDKADYIDSVLTEFLLHFPIETSGDATIEVKIDTSLVYPTWREFNQRLSEIVTSFILEDVLLTPSMFTEDSTYKSYPYKATIPAKGVTESFVTDVVFSIDDAESGLFASVTKSLTDEVVIWAREIPDEDIIIPTIECRNTKILDVPEGDDTGLPLPDGVLEEDDIATDEEAGDVIEDVFGEDGSGDSGDDSGGETVPDDNIATDEEVGDVIEDVFGDGSDDTGGDDTTTDGDNIATDEEVQDAIDDVFGTDDSNGDDATEDEDNIATDEEVQDAIDNVFG